MTDQTVSDATMSNMALDDTSGQAALRVDQTVLDPFERGLLPVLRHFVLGLTSSDTYAWHTAYTIAAQKWGDAVGLAVAHAFFDVIRAASSLETPIICHDPFCLETRKVMTEDEMNLLYTLHHMRRDETAAARETVHALTLGKMDPTLIRAGLRFAARFPAGVAAIERTSRPSLKIVH